MKVSGCDSGHFIRYDFIYDELSNRMLYARRFPVAFCTSALVQRMRDSR